MAVFKNLNVEAMAERPSDQAQKGKYSIVNLALLRPSYRHIALGSLAPTMVEWQNPSVIEYNFFLYDQMAVFLLGFYGWQFLLALHLDWALLVRKQPFKWPHLPYLLSRYMMLSALLFLTFSAKIKTRIDCNAAYKSFATIGSAASFFSSFNICVRPLLIWKESIYVVITLLLATAGHMCLVILQGIKSVTAYWNPDAGSCVVVHSDNHMMAAFYMYTVLIDLLILVLTVHGLMRGARPSHSWLVSALCIQGIGYVVVTCLINIPTVVFAWLNLNPVMNVFFSLPAATLGVVASSAAAISLLEHGAGHESPATPTDPDDPIWLHKNGHSDSSQSTGDTVHLSTHIVITASALYRLDSSELDDDELCTKGASGSGEQSVP
ncbi:hypothetical protein A0H81_01660 [Grifola frondosa]|uniref:Uncharacterized protein n=1 Tax=Grifola frondosa TaxID=5627 RepID=A0A1C7MKC2_GRIFR|nr:hypothetical protein A0H81_01660 [Grifola frondosa]